MFYAFVGMLVFMRARLCENQGPNHEPI